MKLCEFCSTECDLLNKFQQEDEAFRNQMDAFEQLKKLPGTIPEIIETRERDTMVRHLEFRDTLFTIAANRNCPNTFEF